MDKFAERIDSILESGHWAVYTGKGQGSAHIIVDPKSWPKLQRMTKKGLAPKKSNRIAGKI